MEVSVDVGSQYRIITLMLSIISNFIYNFNHISVGNRVHKCYCDVV